MSPIQPPRRLQFNVAQTMFEDPDVTFDDLSEQLMVTNVDKRPVHWRYAQRDYELLPGGKPKPVKLEVIMKYLGDPRSAQGVQNTYRVPGSQIPGTVPDRYKEIRRLAVLYGVYEGLMNKISTLKFSDLQKAMRDKERPDEILFPDMKLDWFVVPRIKVQNLDGVEIKFPVFHPDAYPYRYNSDAAGDPTDVRSELDRLRRLTNNYQERIEALENMEEQGEADIPPAQEDTVAPPL